MTIKLLTKQHLEFLSIKGGRKGSSESTLVKCHIVGNLMVWLIYAPVTFSTRGGVGGYPWGIGQLKNWGLNSPALKKM